MSVPVVILEEINFIFRENELNKITQLHNEGLSITEITKEVGRDEYEILLALVHLHIKRKLTKPIRRI